jgi:hypothetical protein
MCSNCMDIILCEVLTGLVHRAFGLINRNFDARRTTFSGDAVGPLGNSSADDSPAVGN